MRELNHINPYKKNHQSLNQCRIWNHLKSLLWNRKSVTSQAPFLTCPKEYWGLKINDLRKYNQCSWRRWLNPPTSSTLEKIPSVNLHKINSKMLRIQERQAIMESWVRSRRLWVKELWPLMENKRIATPARTPAISWQQNSKNLTSKQWSD